MKPTTFLALTIVLTVVLTLLAAPVTFAAKARAKKAPVAEAPADWGMKAQAELEAARVETAKPASKKGKATAKAAKPVNETAPQTLTDTSASAVLPTAATVRAEVTETQSVIKRTSLRFTVLFEPYQARGSATMAGGQVVDYSQLPTSVLGQIDARWLPFEVGEVRGHVLSLGGYVAGGYARQSLPLVAPSGFRYDDVTLNTLRVEGGAAIGTMLNDKWNLQARLGVGRQSNTQTSKYSDVISNVNRTYGVLAVDASYYFVPRFAVVGSVARRTPIGSDGATIAFDPLTVSGGFLVQVR